MNPEDRDRLVSSLRDLRDVFTWGGRVPPELPTRPEIAVQVDHQHVWLRAQDVVQWLEQQGCYVEAAVLASLIERLGGSSDTTAEQS